ncbi:MAG: hypothetical protein JXR96_00780 [Deltaproteobacteria bacterium]|nr:hypothetical protein [Deltaproteobacteria bacterium]
MKKMLILAAVGLALLAVAAGCGLLDATSGISISLPEQSFDFSLDANQARTQLQQFLASQGPPLNQIDLTGQTEIPAQVCDGGVCVDVPRINETFEIELPAQQVDLSNEPDLRDYVAAGKVKSVYPEYIKYELDANTLNFDLPSADIYMDQHGTQTLGDSADYIARLDSIQAGSTAPGDLQFTSDGRDLMSSHIIPGLKFSMLGKAGVTVDTDQTRTIPGGQLSGRIKVKLKFTVDPI